MDSQLRKVFGFALVFALVFGMVSAERAFAQTTPLDPVDCPGDDTTTIMVDTDTFLTVDDADAAAKDADPPEDERQRTMQELFNCAMQKPGSTLQFADGTYDDVGTIYIGDTTNNGNDGDDPDTEEVTEKVTFRGNPANREAVKFTGEVNFVVRANNILIEYITLEDTESVETVAFWPNITETLEVRQLNLDADKCRENVEIRNCVFRNTRSDGISYHTGSNSKADCDPSGFTVAESLFENIGYNNEWEDGYGPGDAGTGIPKLIPATIEGATDVRSGTTPQHVRESQNVGIRVYGSDLIKNVTIIDNTIDGTTHSGIVVHGVTGVANEDEPEESDKIEISNNSVSNVPRSGIVVLESPTETAAGYDLIVGNNLVVNSGNSPWVVNDYTWYADGLRSNGRYSQVKLILGGGTSRTVAADKRADSVLKPEIWSITPNMVTPGTVIFGSGGAPVKIYDNFGGDDGPTDGRASEYDNDGDRKATSSSKIPGSTLNSGNYGSDRAGSCIGDDSGTNGVNEEHFACFSVIRFLDPYTAGAIQLNGVSTKGNIRITRNELRDNTLGLVLCGGSDCYFDSPYSAITAGYTNNAAFAGAGGEDSKVDISMNNIYGESAMSAGDRAEMETSRGFPVGAVYASIGALEDKVDLSGNYLGANPRLFTDLSNESLERSASDYDLADAKLDIETGPGQRPPAFGLATATFTGDTLTLTYNKPLDGESVPAAEDFTVMVGGEAGPAVTAVSVSGAVVTLTLASAVEDGDEVTVSYTPGENPIRDESGMGAPMLDGAMVSVSMPPMPPGEEEDDDGCALASGGSGVDLGMLLALMVAPFGFAAGRRAREAR